MAEMRDGRDERRQRRAMSETSDAGDDRATETSDAGDDKCHPSKMMRNSRPTYTSETFSEALTVKPNVQALPAPNSITGLWDMNIPTDLLHEILSRLSLKANIQASTVCKTWCEAAVSVRKLQPHPWLFNPLQEPEEGKYILFDPSRSQTYKLNFPELKGCAFSYSRDGWLLVVTNRLGGSEPGLFFLFNPFTREHIYLPKLKPKAYCCLAFSAAPTSSSCLVISLNYSRTPLRTAPYILIDTCRPGETVWTTHRFKNSFPCRWNNCVFSNGKFCFLNTRGGLGVFDPPRATWNILPVKPCRDFGQTDSSLRMMMTEHEGDIFVVFTSRYYTPSVFKLNLKRMAWEKKRELGGLTIFASIDSPLTRASLSEKERNRLYQSRKGDLGEYFSISDEKIDFSRPSKDYFSNHMSWVFPPHNNVTL
ncbi:unnamed protein product [Eruca vesicaria subsp. sativa]|uniref:F-box domain-containing protein n=1 Tax=Eruca vesicaria subsp. sativa TaxID=29727 RepID=A0ABC8JY28_ERUVS|nr:unnamed protein product [Eruca vesicaria subsp. sativa]